tara:strand:+ start:2632 stop:2886 length:255 start_codon:yes stop_codon:yes gene_type:complete
MSFKRDKPYKAMIAKIDPDAKLGVGTSRTDLVNAKKFLMLITFADETRPMKDWIPASSAKEARRFALNRYPKALKIKILQLKGR